MQLAKGQKTPLTALGLTSRMTIDVDFGLEGVDIVAFGLGKDRKIADDRYTVLFSNTRTPEDAIVMRAGHMTTSFDMDLAALPAHIERVMVTATHDTMPIARAKPLVLTIGSASFDAGAALVDERAVMIAELYRHNGEWRIAALGDGFSAGLAKLIEHLGGETSGADTAAAKPATQPAPAPNPSAPAVRPPIDLSKITLEKKQKISLEKTGTGFGNIVLNLNWNKRGARGVDLDIGCLFELADGTRGVIQALGNTFGNYEKPPFIELSGDDRSGTLAEGETIRINGQRFSDIRRLGVFALIYEGAARWANTDARVSITMPNQPELVVEVRDGDDRQKLCGVAVIENEGGRFSLRNHMAYYPSQREFADEIGIVMRWTTGRKN